MTALPDPRTTYLHPEGPIVEIVRSPDDMDRRAADIVANAVVGGKAGTIALPTGGTPVGLYRLLSERIRSGELDFEGVVVFQLDEFRNLAGKHPQSFAVWLRDQLLGTAGIGDDRFHLVPATAADPDSAGTEFETLIDRAGGLDLAVLGLGDNGHVAFNEPGSTLESRTRLLTLSDQTIEQTARAWPSGQDVPREAVTMGIGTLLEARAILLLVKGAAKAAVVRRILIDQPTADVPGSFMRRAGDRLTVVLDEAAASGIQKDLVHWKSVPNRT